jgi:hypothetical protein
MRKYYKEAAEERYNSLLSVAREECDRAHTSHGGMIHYSDFATAAKMSPESARRWLRALCKALGGEWREGHCLCPEKKPEVTR